jgi:hypothetical protein
MLGEKLGGGHADQSADVLRIVSGAPFLRRSKVCPTLLRQRERLPHTGTARGKRTSYIRGLARKTYVSCVSSFPYSVYIDSNRRDSWI